MPSLYDQCIQVLKENVDFIEEVGPLGFDILGPVLEMATKPETLMRIEDCNPHLMTDTDEVGSEFSDDHSIKVITFAAVVEEVREEGVLQQGASGDGELAGDVRAVRGGARREAGQAQGEREGEVRQQGREARG